MSNIDFQIDEYDNFTVISFNIDIIEPSILKNLTPPEVNPTKGVILNGRGPIWLYCFLVHYYHYVSFVATNDPRIGAVVVQSHNKQFRDGDIIKGGF